MHTVAPARLLVATPSFSSSVGVWCGYGDEWPPRVPYPFFFPAMRQCLAFAGPSLLLIPIHDDTIFFSVMSNLYLFIPMSLGAYLWFPQQAPIHRYPVPPIIR